MDKYLDSMLHVMEAWDEYLATGHPTMTFQTWVTQKLIESEQTRKAAQPKVDILTEAEQQQQHIADFWDTHTPRHDQDGFVDPTAGPEDFG